MTPVGFIRALQDYRARSALELSFKAGQILIVVSKKDKYWFEARDPVSDYEGFVPRNFFASFNPEDDYADDELSDRDGSQAMPFEGKVKHRFIPLDNSAFNARPGDRVPMVDDHDDVPLDKSHESDPDDTDVSSNYDPSIASEIVSLYEAPTRPVSHTNPLDATIVRESHVPLTQTTTISEGVNARVVKCDFFEKRWHYVITVFRSADKPWDIIYRTNEELYGLFNLIKQDYPAFGLIMPPYRVVETEIVAKEQVHVFDKLVRELGNLPIHIQDRVYVAKFFSSRAGFDGKNSTVSLTTEILFQEPKWIETRISSVNSNRSFTFSQYSKRDSRDSFHPGTTNDERLKVKLSWKDDLIALRISRSQSLACFKRMILKKLKYIPKSLVEKLYYRDEDGDLITVVSAEDFRVALALGDNLYFFLL